MVDTVEKNYSVATVTPDGDVLAEIAAKHVKKLARVIDEADTGSSARCRGSKPPREGLGKEILLQQIAEKSRIDDIITK